MIRDIQNSEVVAVIERAKGRPMPKPRKEDRPKKRKKVSSAKRRMAKPDPDYWFSLCVRERAGWNCERCAKHYEPWMGANGEPANPGLHCSHYVGRSNYSTRFEPMDVDAHCYACHAFFEGNPHDFKEWKLEKLGQEKYDILIEKARNVMIGKQARKEKQEIADHFKQEFRKMQSARSLSGFDGYLNFAGYL